MNTQRVIDAVSGARLLQRLAQLATYGGLEGGAMNRQALSEHDFDARAWLIGQARQLGCRVWTDPCANLFIRYDGDSELAPVMTGSHIDTQPSGGRLDGCYGVMAGLECLQALAATGVRTRRPIELVVWTNEEGSRFSPGAMGSSAYVDPTRLAGYRRCQDADGVSFGQALDAHAHRFAHLPLRSTVQAHAFVELHIEQGPVLEQAGNPLGVVSGIQGVRWYQVRCHGAPAHAGTTPMPLRRDALLAATACLVRIDALAQRLAGADRRLTFGRWQVTPNSINTIAGQACFSIDFRHADAAVLEAFDAELVTCLPEGAELEPLFSHAPTAFDPAVIDVLEQACAATGMASQSIRSGAFHDAMYLASHCPTAMLFVPSRDGVSHNPLEHTEPQHLLAGARALAWSLVQLADQA
ncbi:MULTISPECIES: M20 family metallo-hydrolase [unclassified Pseudomonas]|uniref:M20 family metallo-hydrolase n=1 Tax=unclassified Pseudomonas TaxID=196821 RepID=UPI000BD52989|nr:MULTISPECIES: M20 family metallo-hydrolase [unclassified Pseudomonas]PVZ19729.1 N-carbamoyl-L-amino-acid hydrolase [Pseudomonas sp. URIL14HWK12:I12]PVZ22686.1 N-carbamoyl-L-amino-acid hydrolase [Pseudomonas sp. URIL14HWK12:I10]PVZ37684.1 N-carbamoyl-L-amino-acid hydrolase [Pseudomonas sp. URIL14HWK12:I11]SNZ15519.1 N-carbamoyl-L-amino-acid hydrolase [Pseudomonas sp. URIL14HWK12:I9]